MLHISFAIWRPWNQIKIDQLPLISILQVLAVITNQRLTCRTSNLTTLQLIHFKGFSSGAYQKLFSFFRLIWESQINWQVSRLMISLMIHNSPHTSYFMIQKEANQCRGWTTETYLSTVTDTVDLKWKLLLMLKKIEPTTDVYLISTYITHC